MKYHEMKDYEMESYYNDDGLRVIRTARSKKKINKAARTGYYYPLIKEVIPSEEIRSQYCVVQDPDSHEIEVIEYFIGHGMRFPQESEIVLGWTSCYPYHFKSPFAAYLIPDDIEVGERVFIEDLIQDFPVRFNLNGFVHTHRLECCEAIWNGEDLEIQYDDKEHYTEAIG